jgi:peptidase E
MRRREFLLSTVAATTASIARPLGFPSQPRAGGTRKILIAGGGYGTPFIRYMAELTGKTRPKLLFLPTASADSATSTLALCWFEEGTTDSRPKELTVVQGLGFLKGSHSPHYDGEKDRRPLYQQMIASGRMKPGYACDNNAGIYFEDNDVKRVVASRAGAKVYYVNAVNGKAVERVLEPELIS